MAASVYNVVVKQEFIVYLINGWLLFFDKEFKPKL